MRRPKLTIENVLLFVIITIAAFAVWLYFNW